MIASEEIKRILKEEFKATDVDPSEAAANFLQLGRTLLEVKNRQEVQNARNQ